MEQVLLMILLLGYGTAQIVPTPSISVQPSTGPLLFPPECEEIINNGPGDDRFGNTSVARALGTFCPVVDFFVRCLEINQAILRNSSVAIYRILGENFNSFSLKSRMNAVCGSIQSVADDLECFKNVSGIEMCSAGVFSTDPTVTIANLCGAASSQETCIRGLAITKCTAAAVDFYVSYSYVFVPDPCQRINTNPPVTGGGSVDSVVFTCARDAYPQLLMDVLGMIANSRNIQPNDISKIIFDSFEGICSNRSIFAACIEQKFIPPFSQFDMILNALLNPKSIGPSLDQYCELTLSSQEEQCLESSTIGMFMCGTILKGVIPNSQSGSSVVPLMPTVISGISVMPTLPPSGTITVTPGVGNVNPNYEELICPGINAVNRCVGVQLRRCSPTLGQTFANVNKLLYSTECQSAEPTLQINSSPFGSVFGICGYPLGGEIVGQILNLNGSQPEEILRIVRDLIPVACGYVDFYTNCIAEELPRSTNIYDRIMMKLFDVVDAGRIKTVLRAVCDQTKVIQDNIQCLADNFGKGFEQCGDKPEYRPLFGKFDNISYIDLNTITELCGPIKAIGNCSANLMSDCSKTLVTTGQNAIYELLRTDCGGERPWTSGAQQKTSNIVLCVLILFSYMF